MNIFSWIFDVFIKQDNWVPLYYIIAFIDKNKPSPWGDPQCLLFFCFIIIACVAVIFRNNLRLSSLPKILISSFF